MIRALLPRQPSLQLISIKALSWGCGKMDLITIGSITNAQTVRTERMGYKIGTLNARDVLRAYALIERVMPGVDLEQWTALTATTLLCRRWFVVKDAEGYIRGIAHVAVRGEGDVRRQVEVPLFVSVSLVDTREVLGLLFSAIRTYAISEKCRTIHIWTAVPPDWSVLAGFLEHGPWDHGLVCGVDDEAPPDHPILPVKM